MRYGTFDVEQRTQEIGRGLFRRVREAGGPFSFTRWLEESFLRLTRRDETIQTQLFRLVEALPALGSASQINDHLREYLAAADGRLPATVQAAVAHWPSDGLLSQWIADVTRANVRRLAHGFVAATDLAEAVRVILELRGRQLAFTVDVLGEAVLAEKFPGGGS